MGAREPYVDLLRAAAILRVYLLHTLWLSWLPAVFPAIPVMFALGGCLAAASLERGGAWRAVTSRLRRLLPPLWVLAAGAVPLMLVRGWPDFRPTAVLYWLVPVANPPTSEWGGPLALALWYLRAYLWLVLLSPALWWAFRRAPRATLAALPAAALVLYLAGRPATPVGDVLWSSTAYGTCWVLGFARHTGLLYRRSALLTGVAAAGLAVAAMAWGITHRYPDELAELLWGLAFVVVLMRARPALSWWERARPLAQVVAFLNARAVTIYVWHLPVMFAAMGLLAYAGRPAEPLITLAVGTPLLAAVVLAAGWVEDLAARRRPRLVPSAPSRRVLTGST
ncbi:acyltransferase [Micromonospora sp. CPCC 205371]|nr:acyltransferase [Micromonospora sp. CPCC 205371]